MNKYEAWKAQFEADEIEYRPGMILQPDQLWDYLVWREANIPSRQWDSPSHTYENIVSTTRQIQANWTTNAV